MAKNAPKKNARGNYDIGGREWTPEELRDLSHKIVGAAQRAGIKLKPKRPKQK
jgi:hypothetical protein